MLKKPCVQWKMFHVLCIAPPKKPVVRKQLDGALKEHDKCLENTMSRQAELINFCSLWRKLTWVAKGLRHWFWFSKSPCTEEALFLARWNWDHLGWQNQLWSWQLFLSLPPALGENMSLYYCLHSLAPVSVAPEYSTGRSVWTRY